MSLLEELLGDCDRDLSPVECALIGDPVNTAVGNFHASVTDAHLPGIGVPFQFSRSYNSLDTSGGPLGPGWTHGYNMSLTVQANGDATARAADGQQISFARQSNGSFWGGPGARSTLASVSGGYELTSHAQIAYRFDTGGRLTSVKDRNAQGVTLSYNGAGELSSITDSAGRVITLTYTNGLLTSLSLPDGRGVSYGYTGGRLTSVTDLRGGTTTYGYDAGGRLASVVDQRGNTVVQNTYGPDGRITQQADALGNTTTFGWDASTETATVTDPRGKAWQQVYSDSVLVKEIDPLGNTTRYGHTGVHLTSVTDPRGHTTTMTHDDRGNLLTRTAPAPLSYQETFTYDAQNNLLTAKDGRGNTTTYGYDASGNLTSIAQPGNAVTQFGRAPTTGLLTSVTDPRGKTTTFDYDASGNLTKVTSPGGSVTTMGYDSAGRMTSLVEPRGNVTGANPADYRWTYTYDAADNLRTETDPLSNATRWAYDPVGNLSSRTDAKNRATSYGYNAANELTSVTAPDSTVTSYGYDAVGNLTTRTDAKSRVTAFAYDAAKRITSVTSPASQVWTYQYDASGNLAKAVNPAGNATPDPADGTITYTFDELNRLTGMDYSDATPDVQFAYDGNGNRTSMADGSGSETYTYDALNRLTGVTRGTDSFAYVYDPAGNVARRTYPDGTVVDYTYDDGGRLASVSSGDAATAYAYDPAGNLTTTTLPSANGHTDSRTYDRAGRLTEVKNAKGTDVLSRFTYTLDPVGNPTQSVTTTETITYKHDSLDQVTEVCSQASCPGPTDPFIRYAYDAVGNRTTETRPTGITTYTYDAADRLLLEAGPSGVVPYTYDPNGNQTAAGFRTYAYDLANRLKSTTSGSTTITYSYDGDGKRLQASSGSQASEKTNYLWDPNAPLPLLASERDGNAVLLRRYVYGNDLLSMTSGGASYYYHYDGLGSVANVTSSIGTLQWSYVYEPFGTVRTEVKNDPQAPTNLMRFTGELYDLDTSLYHLRARQYDPTLGRFLTVDPLAQPVSDPYVGDYIYASNRPTVLGDPSGLRGSLLPLLGGACPSFAVPIRINIGDSSSDSGYEDFQDVYVHAQTQCPVARQITTLKLVVGTNGEVVALLDRERDREAWEGQLSEGGDVHWTNPYHGGGGRNKKRVVAAIVSILAVIYSLTQGRSPEERPAPPHGE